MGKILTQQEIDAIVGHVRPVDKEMSARSVEPWNPRATGQLHNEQARAIKTLHQSIARSLSHSLGAYLRVPFEVSLATVEQLTFAEVLGGIPENTYLLFLDLTPPGVTAALQIDHSIVFPIVDVLLGGTGAHTEINREISEIEAEIMEGVAMIINRELASGWAPLGIELMIGDRLSTAQIQRFLPPREKVLALQFKLSLNNNHGTMNLVFPATVSNALLRKLSLDWEYSKPRASTNARQRLREHLNGCDFKVVLGFNEVKVRVRDLMDAKPGSILPFDIHESVPASLAIGERPVFQASPVRMGSARAAQVLEQAQAPATKMKSKAKAIR